MAEQLRALAQEASVPVSGLPAFVGRPDSSPPKLIDEYNWAVITKGCVPQAMAERSAERMTTILGEPASG